MTAVTIERAGLQTLVVDRGRFGHRHEGVAWSGPADTLAFEVANALSGADRNAAMFEVAFGDLCLRFDGAASIALAGADCDATIDERRCAPWSVHHAAAGARLHLRAPKRGVFTYVAIGGGIDVPSVLGSRTTDRVAAFGGLQGRTLRNGDTVNIVDQERAPSRSLAISAPQRRDRIRVIPCAEYGAFDDPDSLLRATWRIGRSSNRMGYRLEGVPLRYTGGELRSHAVFPGVIQVPPSGEPIVLLADAHTTGGYPKAGIVIEEDLRHVAQSRPGEEIAFVSATAEEAESARDSRAGYVQAISERVREWSR
jgi:biotin-dependent carboxylase-like uncharacterized protein